MIKSFDEFLAEGETNPALKIYNKLLPLFKKSNLDIAYKDTDKFKIDGEVSSIIMYPPLNKRPKNSKDDDALHISIDEDGVELFKVDGDKGEVSNKQIKYTNPSETFNKTLDIIKTMGFTDIIYK